MSDPASARDTRDRVRSRTRSAVDVCQVALARLEAVEPRLHAFNTVIADQALARAAAMDREPNRWRDAPLTGVPVAVKDNICTCGVRTTASSKILETFVPPYSATAITRLEAAGAVMIGKTNCDEFAMGSSNENSAFGSDTGGSIRQPAALCGIVGLKPTYGRVSRYGLIAFGSSLDQIGPLTTTVGDAAVLLAVLAGRDPADSTSAVDVVPDYSAALTGDVRGTTIGVPRRLLDQGVDPDVARAVNGALDVLGSRGATIADIELPHASYAIPVYYLVATAEASSNLARYDGVRYGLRSSAGSCWAPTY